MTPRPSPLRLHDRLQSRLRAQLSQRRRSRRATSPSPGTISARFTVSVAVPGLSPAPHTTIDMWGNAQSLPKSEMHKASLKVIHLSL